jgi:hypothetical protein
MYLREDSVDPNIEREKSLGPQGIKSGTLNRNALVSQTNVPSTLLEPYFLRAISVLVSCREVGVGAN